MAQSWETPVTSTDLLGISEQALSAMTSTLTTGLGAVPTERGAVEPTITRKRPWSCPVLSPEFVDHSMHQKHNRATEPNNYTGPSS